MIRGETSGKVLPKRRGNALKVKRGSLKNVQLKKEIILRGNTDRGELQDFQIMAFNYEKSKS